MSKRKYYLTDSHPILYFTPQEARCMYHAFHGLNNEETAKAMNFSKRTAAWNFENMRQKIGASHKKWLADKIKKTRFMQYINHLSVLEKNKRIIQELSSKNSLN